MAKTRFNYGDIVSFSVRHDGKNVTLTGTVEIIDAYGTFGRPDTPSYDILVQNSPHYDGKPCLYKHIPEEEVQAAEDIEEKDHE